MFISLPTYAEQSIFINEFLIDPQQQVELFNTGSEPLNISGWYIDDSGGTTYFTIPENTILYPNSCLVFTADFNLNKSSADTIRLFDTTAPPTNTSSHLVDSYSYTKSMGINISYLRIPNARDWSSGEANIGKHNDTKESCIVSPSPSPSTTPSTSPTMSPPPVTPSGEVNSPTPLPLTATTTPSYSHISINEVMVYPDTNEKEWVELYNDNDFSVELIDWYIDDAAQIGSTPKLFSITIPSKSLRVIELSSSLFNNDGDQVRLLDQLKNEKDSFEYSQAEKGKSWGRISENFCQQLPTRGTQNSSCTEPTSIPTSTTSPPRPTIFSQTSRITPMSQTTRISPSQSLSRSSTNNHLPTPAGSGIGSKNMIVNHEDSGEVLGIDTQIPTKKNPQMVALIKTLSFSSFSFSLLSIFSLVLKRRNVA